MDPPPQKTIATTNKQAKPQNKTKPKKLQQTFERSGLAAAGQVCEMVTYLWHPQKVVLKDGCLS